MYYFVEYMRAKYALRIALILLAFILLIAVILRLSLHAPTVSEWTSGLESAPGAHTTRTQLPNGAVRTVVDNPRTGMHAVLVRTGDVLHVDVVQPRKSSDSGPDFISMGNLNVERHVEGHLSHVVIDYRRGFTFDIGLLFFMTVPIGLVVATLLGGALSKENDGHLEMAWTKPVSRERLALASILVGITAIVTAQILTAGVIVLGSLMFAVPGFSASNWLLVQVLIAFFGPIAWYALLTALSASVKRGPGLVIGMAWFLSFIVPGLVGALSGAARFNVVAAAFYTIFRTICYLDPLAYLSIRVMGHRTNVETFLGTSLLVTLYALVALSIGYIALSVLQWRRVEA